jgi:protein-L-isoaspartate O-methyltransferase
VKVYDNKPNKISKGQNMTDLFTHAIILNNVEPHLKIKDNLKVLDIGTGHGYIAFAIWMLAK